VPRTAGGLSGETHYIAIKDVSLNNELSPAALAGALRRSSVCGSAAEPIGGSGIVAPGEIQQFALGIRKPALGRDAAKPVREFVVMPPGIG